MQSAHSLSDVELLARMPVLVRYERAATADVIEHLIEVDRRQLYLGQACSSLSAYCRERLGYSEDEASKRVRVARLARDLPAMLDELRGGRIHLTGLFVLSHFATPANASELIAEARGKTRRELECALAARFPKADVPERVVRQTGDLFQSKTSEVKPLSAAHFAIQFTASAELKSKLDRAKQLLSHSIPSGDLAQIVERALDALLALEERQRLGPGRPGRRRPLKDGWRHVPVDVARIVRERDGAQCTFVGEQGQRCSERRFITLEHRFPFAMGGTSLDPENLCLLCRAHNQHTARQAYGAEYIARKRRERTRAQREPAPSETRGVAPEPELPTKASGAHQADPTDGPLRQRVLAALCGMGFQKHHAAAALRAIPHDDDDGAPVLLRTAIEKLTPNAARCA